MEDISIPFPYIRIYFTLFLCLDLITLYDTHHSQHLASAFNIDEDYPIVISNRFNGKEAHFGASVVLMPSATTGTNGHHGNDDLMGGNSNSNITGWIIIGAPKANSTSAKHSNVFEPGLLWRCSLGGYQNTGDNNANRYCEMMNIDPTGEYDPRDPNMPFKDKKDGGWLGGSMFVGDSDRFVACASRWINQKYKDTYLQNGICYWLPKNELVRASIGSKWPLLPPKLSYRLSPLLTKMRQYQTVTSSQLIAQLDRNMSYDWAYGQFGFSTHLTADNELISGSPGIFDWTGSVVYYRDTLGPQPQLRRYNAHPGSPAFSEVLVAHSQALDPVITRNDYLGYAVSSGKFFTPAISKHKTQFAAGAPRSSHLSGKVIIFTLEEMRGNRSVGKVELLGEPLEGHDALNGNHYASYFGSVLLALDVNGDGFDDLLVGAPLFGAFRRYKRNAASAAATLTEHDGGGGNNTKGNSTDETTPQAKIKSGDEGCVFVYLSTGEEFSLTPQQLFGDKISGARFGMAVSSLRDINYDGFNDVAIGAPYENEGRGAVYIYHGGKDLMTLVQKLKPELIDPTIRSFGGSLSLGVDVDANGYPDLAVGAYETNQVVIYRTIPIIHFASTLTATIPKLLSTTDEFNLTSCISYSGHGTIPTVLAIWLNLTVEVDPMEGKKESLVALVDEIADGGARLQSRSQSQTNNRVLLLSYQRRLYVRRDGTGSCYNFSAVRVGSLDIVSRTVSIRQSYRLDGYQESKGPPKPIHYDIYPGGISPDTNLSFLTVNLSQSKSQFGEFLNAKLLMSEGKKSVTNHLLLPVATICEADGDSECLTNLTISAWLHDLHTGKIYDSNHPFTLGTTDILALHVELTNSRETANLPVTISLKWQPTPVVRRLPSNCEYSIGKSLVCSLPRAIKENQTEVVAIEFEMFGFYGRAPEIDNILDISFEANTSSALIQPATQSLAVPLLTSMKPQNYSHKSSKIEYSVGNVSIPTFGFTQGFEVGLIGPSKAAGILVTFDIPVGLYLPSDDNSGRDEYHWLIGVRKPIVTYDGKMKCKPVNGSFLDEKDILNELNIYELPSLEINNNEDEEADNDIGNLDDDYSVPRVSEATKILQGKIRRVRRSLVASVFEESKGSHDLEFGGIEKINCDPSSSSKSTYVAKCLRVVCTASHFTPSKKAVIEFKLRMFNKVAGKLLNLLNADEKYEDGVSSLWIESFGVVRTLSVDGRPFGENGSLQFTSRLKIPPPYDLPAWIVIVSVGGGLLIFTVMAWMLKRCGFFRRSKRDELIRRRVAELERSQQKSTPVNSPSTSSTARMRTNSKSRSQKDRYNDHNGTNQEYDIPRCSGNGSMLGLPVGTPTSPVRQREMPGAVDLHELRRLYECENDNHFY